MQKVDVKIWYLYKFSLLDPGPIILRSKQDNFNKRHKL